MRCYVVAGERKRRSAAERVPGHERPHPASRGDPPEMAERATAALAGDEQLLLSDLVLAECVDVLPSTKSSELGWRR